MHPLKSLYHRERQYCFEAIRPTRTNILHVCVIGLPVRVHAWECSSGQVSAGQLVRTLTAHLNMILCVFIALSVLDNI